LKRSSRTAALAACLLVFVTYPAVSDHKLEIFSNTKKIDEGTVIELRTINLPRARLETALKMGHSAEIRYHIRVFSPREGLFSLIGDALELERTTVYTGMWNPVLEGYTLEENGERRFFSEYRTFIAAFSSVSLPPYIYAELSEGRYIHAKATLIPEVPVPPFTLLSPFLPNLRVSSPWRRVAEADK